MIVRFDKLNRYETPELTLCNPGATLLSDNTIDKSLGVIPHATDIEAIFNFNSASELNYRLNVLPDADDFARDIYAKHEARRLVYFEEIGFFIINAISKGYDSSGVEYKDARCYSLEYEFESKTTPYLENGSYTIGSIVSELLKGFPRWRLGTVDKRTSSLHRYLEDIPTDKNCLAYMLEDLQQSFECIFMFDTVNRMVNIRDRDSFVVSTDINLYRDDLINNITIEEDSSDIYTAMTITGQNGLNIAAVNPNRTATIYDYSYYVDWMDDDMSGVADAVKLSDEYEELIYKEAGWRYDKLDAIATNELESQRLVNQKKLYIRCRNNIVASNSMNHVDDYNKQIKQAGGKEVSIDASIQEALKEIDIQIGQLDTSISRVKSQIEADKSMLESNTKYQDLLKEYDTKLATLIPRQEDLSDYTFNGFYQDEFITVGESMSNAERLEQMHLLYKKGRETLRRAARPQRRFTINVENFLFVKEFSKWTDQLETGCLIHVETSPDEMEQIFLTAIQVNYEDQDLSLTFGNSYNKYDTKSLFDNVLGSVKKSANTLADFKELLYPIKQGELDLFKEQLENSRNLSMQQALASENEDVVIDHSGYTGRTMLPNGEYDPKQIKITGKNIVFTNDNWETASTAIGELPLPDGSTAYGINAEVIIGDMIMGSGLRILDKNGNELFTIVDSVNASVDELKRRLESGDFDVEGLKDVVVEKAYGLPETPPTDGWSPVADTSVIDTSGRVTWYRYKFIWDDGRTTYGIPYREGDISPKSNLLIDSGRAKTISSFGASYEVDPKMVLGETYTMTFWADGGKNIASIGVSCDGKVFNPEFREVSNGVYQAAFKWSGDYATSDHGPISIISTGDSSLSEVKQAKLEIGTTGTAWVPNKRDRAYKAEEALNKEFEASNSYIRVSSEDGLIVYDTPDINNASRAVQVSNGGIRVANQKDPNGNWVWTSFLTGDGIVGQQIRGENIVAGAINTDHISAGGIDAGKITIGEAEAHKSLDKALDDLSAADQEMLQSAISEAQSIVENTKIAEAVENFNQAKAEYDAALLDNEQTQADVQAKLDALESAQSNLEAERGNLEESIRNLQITQDDIKRVFATDAMGRPVISSPASSVSMVLDNDRLSIQSNGVELAFFGQDRLYITTGEMNELIIGRYHIYRSDGDGVSVDWI
jgi:hypothetical protein